MYIVMRIGCHYCRCFQIISTLGASLPGVVPVMFYVSLDSILVRFLTFFDGLCYCMCSDRTGRSVLFVPS